MRRLIPGLFVLSLGISGAAAADPVTLISGSAWLYGDDAAVMANLPGKGFGGGGSGGAFAQGFFHRGQTFRTMSTGPLSGSIGGFIQRGVPGNATVTPVVVPSPASPSGPAAHVPSPLAPGGTVQIFTTTSQTSSLVGPGLSGPAGIVTQTVGNALAGAGGLGVTAAPAANPSATPEPASLLLLGTGLAAATWQTRRRRRRAN